MATARETISTTRETLSATFDTDDAATERINSDVIARLNALIKNVTEMAQYSDCTTPRTAEQQIARSTGTPRAIIAAQNAADRPAGMRVADHPASMQSADRPAGMRSESSSTIITKSESTQLLQPTINLDLSAAPQIVIKTEPASAPSSPHVSIQVENPTPILPTRSDLNTSTTAAAANAATATTSDSLSPPSKYYQHSPQQSTAEIFRGHRRGISTDAGRLLHSRSPSDAPVSNADLSISPIRGHRLMPTHIVREKPSYTMLAAVIAAISSGSFIISVSFTPKVILTWIGAIAFLYLIHQLQMRLSCGLSSDGVFIDSRAKYDYDTITLRMGETIYVEAIPVFVDTINANEPIAHVPFYCDASIIHIGDRTYVRLTNLYRWHRQIISCNLIYTGISGSAYD
jgi:hypothetical protein